MASPNELTSRGAVVALGTFDGVHEGHRTLLRRVRDLSAQEDRDAQIITFFPPPKALFLGTPYLATPPEKRVLLQEFEPQEVAILPFDREYARTDKSAFLQQLATLEPHAIVVGEDFRFGADRAGGLDDLQHVPERLEVVRLQRDEGGKISSSRIRECLADGDVREAARLLGGPYLAIGTVEEGERRGRTIGFPTANLSLPEGKALPTGVYAVTVNLGDGSARPGMANVGPRPTYPDGVPALEVHLLRFRGELVGQELQVRFIERLRPQRLFSGLEELKEQLARDREAADAALAAYAARLAGTTPVNEEARKA